MKTTTTITCAALVLGSIAGCASKPPAELRDARVAYQQAMHTPGSNLVQADLHESKKALDRAEDSFKDNGDDQQTRDLAYVASRRAQTTQARAATMLAVEQKRTAEAQMQQIQQQRAAMMQSELERTKGQLSQQEQMTASERQARVAAEQKTQQALEQIQGLQSKLDQRGLVLTLSGSVLFAFGKSSLLPTAQNRLQPIVEALKQDKRHIMIVGHTDSVGSDDHNLVLSQKRADAVRTYLVTHGIPDSRIETRGAGETEPIATNATPEGRANNRRVEIILEKSGMEEQPQEQQQPSGGGNTP